MELTETSTIQIPKVLDRQSLRHLRASLEGSDSTALVLRGSAEVFCEGMDLAGLDQASEVRSGLEEYAAFLYALRMCPRATIAVVEGRAFAGGIGLIAACDLALSSEDATFGLSELLFGMMPAVVFPFLLERVPPQKARLWALSARTMSAGEAREMGLIDVVAPRQQMEHALHSWTRQISRPRPESVEAWKRYTAGFALAGLRAATDAGVERMLDPATASSVRRFLDEGAAPWL